MPDIFDEVSEDLRADRARALLRRYGVVLAGAMVLTLIGVGVADYYEKQAGQTKSAAADKFIAAQDSYSRVADNPGLAPPAGVTAAFADIAHNGPNGYRILSKLQLAALDWTAGHHEAAIAAWQAIAADANTPPLLRDLATLTSVQHQVDTGDAAALKAQLLPLIQGASRFRPLAEQVTALLDLRLGRRPEAEAIMKSLAADANAPPGVRQMAQDLLLTMTEDAPAQKGAGPHG